MLIPILLSLLLQQGAAPSPRVSMQDFQPLLRHAWTGEMVAGAGQPGSGQSVQGSFGTSADDPALLVLRLRHAQDSTDFGLSITRQGRRIDGFKVMERTESKIGTIQIVAERQTKGTRYRETYHIGSETFGIRQDLLPKGAQDWEVVQTVMLHR